MRKHRFMMGKPGDHIANFEILDHVRSQMHRRFRQKVYYLATKCKSAPHKISGAALERKKLYNIDTQLS